MKEDEGPKDEARIPFWFSGRAFSHERLTIDRVLFNHCRITRKVRELVPHPSYFNSRIRTHPYSLERHISDKSKASRCGAICYWNQLCYYNFIVKLIFPSPLKEDEEKDK
ncbi:hypothetical protein NPIL_205031 [Nephila pilipes]|uniref:Uncharacterized protein n=1 Tax=Nephila pilipes TaxID=299642 RepID=A0A8X6R2A3_NEPPI|nr:hypothetical protein NPIL_205031 [Nephila pilipes]